MFSEGYQTTDNGKEAQDTDREYPKKVSEAKAFISRSSSDNPSLVVMEVMLSTRLIATPKR